MPLNYHNKNISRPFSLVLLVTIHALIGCGGEFEAKDLSSNVDNFGEYSARLSITEAIDDGVYQNNEAIDLKAEVTSNKSLSYQWQSSVNCTGTFTNISGATQNELRVYASTTKTCYSIRVLLAKSRSAYIDIFVAEILASMPVISPTPTPTVTSTPTPTPTPSPSITTTPPPQPATTADQDFADRANASGVVKVNGFNTQGAYGNDLVRCDVDNARCNLHARGDGQYRAGIDTTIKKSGQASLKFHLEKNHAFANIAGQFLPKTNDGLGAEFGEGSTMYVQFSVRFSPEMFSNKLNYWDSYWKVSMFHMNQQSCGSKELATNAIYDSDIAGMYTDCGPGLVTELDGQTRKTPNPPYAHQQGTHLSCQYGNATNCFRYPPNKWITLYYKIKLGQWEQANSSIEAWYSIDGNPYVKWINATKNFRIDCNGNYPCPNEVFNNLTLTPYMTGLSRAAPVDAYVWYDELIVSTMPIAHPKNP